MKSVGEKLVALGEAIPESAYEWRPMAGTRSVREVLLLIASENYGLLGNVLGSRPPAEFADGQAGVERLQAIQSKSEVLRHLRASVETVRQGFEAIPTKDLAVIPFFNGQMRPLNIALAAVMGDQHEHLGQLIAYARSNGVVPPWSRPAGM